MLIERFDLIKRALAFQRLFLISKYGYSSGISQTILRDQLVPLVAAETKISLIQTQLSELCSQVRCYHFVYFEPGIDHKVWRGQIDQIRNQISLPGPLKLFIDGRPIIELTDPLFRTENEEMDGVIMGWLLAGTNGKELSAIEHYTGHRIAKDFPIINSRELDIAIDEIKACDINTPGGLKWIENIIGKDHAWIWRRAMGISLLKRRMS